MGTLYLISDIRGLDTPVFKVFGNHRWQFMTFIVHALISIKLKDYMNTSFPLKRENPVTQSTTCTSIPNATLMESCTIFPSPTESCTISLSTYHLSEISGHRIYIVGKAEKLIRKKNNKNGVFICYFKSYTSLKTKC